MVEINEREDGSKGDSLNVTVYDGKYTVVQDNKGAVRALRYGEEWRDCVGDGLILALAQEVDELRQPCYTAIRMAKAIQCFRNLGMLGKLTELRGTPEYDEMCNAWKEFDDITGQKHRVL